MSVSIFCQKLEFVNLVMSMLNVKPGFAQAEWSPCSYPTSIVPLLNEGSLEGGDGLGAALV